MASAEIPLVVYERLGHEGRRPSPFSWRVRYALAHKGLDAEFVGMRFADADRIRALSGQPMVPVLRHGDRVVHDSWLIAVYLEDAFAARPSLFGGPIGLATARFINNWCDGVLHEPIRRLIYPDFIDCLDAGDRAYFRRSREAGLGLAIESLAAEAPRWRAVLAKTLAPLEGVLDQQDFLSGAAPAYGDYIVFSAFQWARLGSPMELLTDGDPIRRWRARMIELYDGLADRFPAHPAAG